MAEAIADYVLTDHAATEIERRGLSVVTIDGILKSPEQRLEVRPGRVVLQSRVQELVRNICCACLWILTESLLK